MRLRGKTRLVAVLAIGVCTSTHHRAVAEEEHEPAALAEALFREGKKLMGSGRYDEACAKLSESQRLDPGSGTLLTLALCHEAEGKTASAWAEFHEALSTAIKDGRNDRKAVAKTHIATLEPKLCRITVSVPSEARIEGLEVRLDGIVLAAASWGVATPADPGVHKLEAGAHGRRTFQTEIELRGDGEAREVSVPALVLEAPAELSERKPSSDERAAIGHETPARVGPPGPSERAASSPNGTRRILMFGAAGIGLAGIGVGTWAGISAIHLSRDADRRCPASACADAGAVQLNDDSKVRADVATAAFLVGAAGLGVATYLFLTSDSERASARTRAAKSYDVTPFRFGPVAIDVGWGPSAVAGAAW